MKRSLNLLFLLLLAASPLILTLPWKDWIQHGEAIRTLFVGLGAWSTLAFLALTTLATALGIPRLVFCIMGGWLFGFELGFVWSQLGSLIGAYVLFLFARRTRPEALLARYPRLRAMSAPVGRGWFSVLVVRQLPLAGLYNDILLAWSPVTHRDFWIGSFIGFLPLGVTASLVGAGALNTDLSQMGLYLATASVAFVTLNALVKWGIRRRSALKENAV